MIVRNTLCTSLDFSKKKKYFKKHSGLSKMLAAFLLASSKPSAQTKSGLTSSKTAAGERIRDKEYIQCTFTTMMRSRGMCMYKSQSKRLCQLTPMLSDPNNNIQSIATFVFYITISPHLILFHSALIAGTRECRKHRLPQPSSIGTSAHRARAQLLPPVMLSRG